MSPWYCQPPCVGLKTISELSCPGAAKGLAESIGPGTAMALPFAESITIEGFIIIIGVNIPDSPPVTDDGALKLEMLPKGPKDMGIALLLPAPLEKLHPPIEELVDGPKFIGVPVKLFEKLPELALLNPLVDGLVVNVNEEGVVEKAGVVEKKLVLLSEDVLVGESNV